MFTSCNNEPNSSVLSKYVVTFDAAGGGASTTKVEVTEGSTVTNPEDPTKEHYSFEGWYLNDEKFDFSNPIKSNITLVAKWSFSSHSFVNNICTICGDMKCGDEVTGVLKDGTLTISGSGPMYDWLIEEESAEVLAEEGSESSNIVIRDQPWKEKLDEITKVIVAEGITKIGSGAFFTGVEKLNNITDIEISKTVETIGAYAFACSSFEKVKIPEGVKNIEEGAFGYSTKLKEITLPKTIENFDQTSIFECNSLQTLYYNGTEDMLWDKKILRLSGTPTFNIIFGDGTSFLLGIEYKEDGTAELTSVSPNAYLRDPFVIPGVVTYISHNIFQEAIEIKNLIIEDSDKPLVIDSSAFQKCTSLESIKLPNGRIEKIESCLFFGCTSLKSATIPEGVKEIRASLFEGCTSLETVVLPSTITIIWMNNFNGCTNLKHIYVNKNRDDNLFNMSPIPEGCTIHWNSTGPSTE